MIALAALVAALQQSKPAYAQGTGPGCTFEFDNNWIDFYEGSIYPDGGLLGEVHNFEISASLTILRPRAINPTAYGTIEISGCGSIGFSTPGVPDTLCCTQPITCGGKLYSAADVCDMAYGAYYDVSGFDLTGPLGATWLGVFGTQEEPGWEFVYYLYGQNYTTTEILTHLIPLTSGETFEIKYEYTFGDMAIISILIVIATILSVRLVYDVVRNVWFALRLD